MPSFMVGAKTQRREDRLAAMPARRDDLNPGGIIHQVWWSNTEGGVAAAWSPTVPPYPALRSLVVSPTAIGYIYPWTKAFTVLSVPKPHSSLWSLSSLLLPLSILISHAHNATEQQKSFNSNPSLSPLSLTQRTSKYSQAMISSTWIARVHERGDWGRARRQRPGAVCLQEEAVVLDRLP
jgi:hypothetical protein